MSTCVVVMNREGIALAADSAVTIEPINITNNADKILPLHNYSKAGVIYADTAEYMNFPVKTLLQLFDQSLKSGYPPISSMKDLTNRFITFLSNYPFQEYEYQRFIKSALWDLYNEIFTKDFDVEELRAVHSNLGLPSNPKFANQIRKRLKKLHQSTVEEFVENRDLDLSAQDKELLIETLIELFSRVDTLDDAVNMIFAGYGSNHDRPSVYEIFLYGQIDSIVLFEEYNDEQISSEKSLGVYTLAQARMVQLIQDGVPFEMLRKLNKERLDLLIDYFKADPGDSPLKDRKFLAFLNENAEDIFFHSQREAAKLTEHNWYPLFSGLRYQTISSLADYVEILVKISILNNRYTRNGKLFETVGGPVDVATITLVDGFQWRHYKGNNGK